MVYKKLEELLNTSKVDYKDFFQAIKMSSTGYYKMIKEKTMKVEVLERIAAYFKVSPIVFFETSLEKSEKPSDSAFQRKLIECMEKKEQLYDEQKHLYERLVSSEAEKVQILKQVADVKAKPVKS